jgi:hypothetical protein
MRHTVNFLVGSLAVREGSGDWWAPNLLYTKFQAPKHMLLIVWEALQIILFHQTYRPHGLS